MCFPLPALRPRSRASGTLRFHVFSNLRRFVFSPVLVANMSTETSGNSSNNAASSFPPPPARWAQRNDKLIFIISLEDCKCPQIELTEKKMHFKGKGGVENKEYELRIEFYDEINPQESKYSILDREIDFILKKTQSGPYWPRLLKTSTKAHWLKTDFDKWKDEDDSGSDAGEDYKLEDMMNSMGGLGQGDLAGEDEEDSDDENLPDLE